MKILIAIPHFYRPTSVAPDGRAHGSVNPDPTRRVAALTACLRSLQLAVAPRACVLDHSARSARRIASDHPAQIDAVICTSGEHHLLPELRESALRWQHHRTDADPPLLGYECHAVLRDRADQYDVFGYLEDDLLIGDPAFFRKVLWFNRLFGDARVLQPNRFEAGRHPHVDKIYVDGDLPPHCTAPSRARRDSPRLTADFLGLPTTFCTGLNPHAGCFFLTRSQMAYWAGQADFLDRSPAFIGTLESAATLGLMRAFSVYKPALENADFLDVQHFGTAYLGMVSGSLPLIPNESET